MIKDGLVEEVKEIYKKNIRTEFLIQPLVIRNYMKFLIIKYL
jgi:hypothetical protein